jgi:tRNA (guanine37-N1)-methyltransferase
MFPGTLGFSIAKKAFEAKLWNYKAINIRDYAKDKYKTVDDAPFGGGVGMVMRPDVLGDAIEKNIKPNTKIIYMSPRGQLLNQSKISYLASFENIMIICGRYEGIDERILIEYDVEEISIGDYILSGGELPALTLMDACIRTIPGVISKKEALNEESFTLSTDYAGLLEYPLYTRPSIWKKHKVPDVLVSGNHSKINEWKLSMSIDLTRTRRKDLYKKYLKNN